jgi:hypothetical protein
LLPLAPAVSVSVSEDVMPSDRVLPRPLNPAHAAGSLAAAPPHDPFPGDASLQGEATAGLLTQILENHCPIVCKSYIEDF